MATYTLWYMGQGSTESSESKTFARFHIRPENFYSEVEANIPPYSIIDKVIVTIEIKRDGSSLSFYDNDLWWHAYNTENVVVYDSEKLTEVITTSFKSFSHDYTRFFQSGTVQAGKLKTEYGRLAFSGSGTLSRKYTVQKRKIEFTYTPPTLVTYDSIFSYQKWKNSGIVSGHSAIISNITDTGFTIAAEADDAYTGDSPFVSVVPGNKYTIEYDYSGIGNEVFVFYHTSDSVGWDDLTSSSEKKFDFTVPSGHPYITIRCDSNIQGNAVSYSNFRIYPASEAYMSNSVSALERSDVNSWSMPTPQREGYTFLGWYTGINGSGTKYTASSAFPTGDLVLYSAWEANQYYLDLNGFIDGASTGGISPVGTADVYINGALASNDCTDYYAQHIYGSTYEIKDIRANPGYRYVGVKSGSLSGTITGDTAVVLEFERLPPQIADVKLTYQGLGVNRLNKVPCGEGFLLSVQVTFG